MKLLQKAKGFTLIELIIVIAFFGILVVIVISNFLSWREKKHKEAYQLKPAVTTEQTVNKNGSL